MGDRIEEGEDADACDGWGFEDGRRVSSRSYVPSVEKGVSGTVSRMEGLA